jgi:hypothetical protein
MTKKRRFYKANLPAVIWDPKADTSMAEFIDGEFITTSSEVADILIKKGYPEVAIDAVDPPDFEVPRGDALRDDVPVMPPKYDEGAALNKQRSQAALAKTKSNKSSKKPALEKKSKNIKRRGK